MFSSNVVSLVSIFAIAQIFWAIAIWVYVVFKLYFGLIWAVVCSVAQVLGDVTGYDQLFSVSLLNVNQ